MRFCLSGEVHFGVQLVFFGVGGFGSFQPAIHLGLQFGIALHERVTHRFVFGRVRLDLRAVQRDVAQFQEPGCAEAIGQTLVAHVIKALSEAFFSQLKTAVTKVSGERVSRPLGRPARSPAGATSVQRHAKGRAACGGGVVADPDAVVAAGKIEAKAVGGLCAEA